MAVTHYDLTATFTDLLGTAYSPTSAKVVAWIETNIASSEGIVDEVANSIALGGSRQVADSSGNVTWTNLVGSDSTPADINLESGTLQYRVTAEYVDAITRRRKTWVSGWFSLTADIDLADVVAETYVPAAWMTTATATLQTYVDSGQAAATTASAAATTASGAADTAVNASNLAELIALGDADAAFGVAQLNPASPLSVAQGDVLDDPTHPLTVGLSNTIATEVPAASTTTPGRVELATTAETTTGTDAVRATTPAGVRAAIAALVAPFDVKASFGAIGDGVTNDTAAVQAAITAAEAAYDTDLDPVGVQPTVYFPSGSYSLDPITLTKAVALVGEGPSSTILRLRAGNTGSLITITVSDVVGTSVEDADHPVVSHMQLHGNRTDSVTVGTSHGINCPNAAYAEATQYATSFRGSNLVISNFTGDGIFLGTNRNWMLLEGAIIRYNNLNGIESYGFDHRISNCDLGINAVAGFRAQSGGAVSFVGVNTYGNQYGVRIDPSATAPFWFTNSSFDLNKREGASIEGPGAGTSSIYGFINCRFTGNSTDGANTYSDIKAVTAGAVIVLGSSFLLGAQTTKYLIETTSVDQVAWNGNSYLTSGSTPFGTAVTNDFTKLRYAGGRDAWIGPNAGLNTLSAMIGATEVWKATATAFRVQQPLRVESTNPRIWAMDTDAGADAKRWLLNFDGNNMQFLASDDAEAAFGTIFSVTRSGTSVTKMTLGAPVVLKTSTTAGRPSAATSGAGATIYDTTLSKPIYSDGTTWRDAAGTAV